MKKFIFLILFSTLTSLSMTEDEKALFAASSRGDVAKIASLLRQGVDVNLQDDVIGQTPLHAAAGCGNINAVKVLLKNGADVNKQTLGLQTPFHYGVEFPAIVKLLLACGASSNIQDRCMITPLHLAARANSKKSVIYLLANGANPEAKDMFMVEPLGYATSPEVIDILSEDNPERHSDVLAYKRELRVAKNNYLKVLRLESGVKDLRTLGFRKL